MELIGFIFIFVLIIFSYVALKFIIFQRARRKAEILHGTRDASVTLENGISQTFIIAPVYTIEANREPVPYEAALAMPRTTTRSIEITNKSYDDDLPSYDQAIIFSNSTVSVPAPATNDAVR